MRDFRLRAGSLEIARTAKADFLILAGDTFEHHGIARAKVREVASMLAQAPCPVYVLPGNHDPASPGSVWEDDCWTAAKSVYLLLRNQPVEIPGGTLFPCPALTRTSVSDPIAWIPPAAGSGYRIGVAHGSVSGHVEMEPCYPIPVDAADRLQLDYLALGHYHSAATYDGGSGVMRMAYSGTHEPTSFGERDSGNVLLVNIDAPGASPRIDTIPSHVLDWRTLDRTIRSAADLAAVAAELAAITDPEHTLVRCSLSGEAALAGRRSGATGGNHRQPVPVRGIRHGGRGYRHGRRQLGGRPAGRLSAQHRRPSARARVAGCNRGRGPGGTAARVAGGATVILTRVEIEGVRCFGDPVQVLLSKDGINLVAGPNGSGKSTFIEAVRRCLLDLHTSATASNLAPWADGRAPEITVEFEHGGSFYRLSKRFLKRKSAKLERKKGKSWIVLQEGKEADEEVRRLLRSGGRDDDGLLSVLWSPQGKLPLEGVPGAVLDDLRGALGTQMGHPALEKELGKLYESNFQPSRGLPKKGRLHQIQSQRANVEAAADGARATLDTAEGHGGKAAQFRAEIQQLYSAMAVAAPLLEDAERKAVAIAELTHQAGLRLQEYNTLDALHGALWQRTNGTETESATRDRLVAAVPALLAAQERAESAERGAVTVEATARDAVQRLSQPDPLVQSAAERVGLAEQWSGLSARADALEIKLAKLAALAAEEQQAATELQKLNAPDRVRLAKIRQASERLREARVWLEKLELRLELVAETDLSVEVSAGEPSGAASLRSGATYTARGNRVVALRLPGIAALRVSGPETDADKWQEAANGCEGELASLWAPFGTDDIAALAARCDRRVELEAELLRIQKGHKELFAGTDQAGLVAELDRLRKELAGINEKEPQWPAAAPELAELRRESDTLRQTREQALAGEQHQWHAAQQELSQSRIVLQKAAGALETNRAQLGECEGRLRRLRDDGKTDEQRRQELDDYARKRDGARTALNDARAALEALPANAARTRS